MKKSLAFVLACTTGVACNAQIPEAGLPKWVVGYWVQTQDEDGAPGDDGVEFWADGTVTVYDAKCGTLSPGTAHFHDGLLYSTFVARKGPISLLYAPTADHKQLVLTSIRTGNNATYERSAGCKVAER
ncbi:hypothetical protein [Lysobacter sp. HA35]